MDVEFLDVLLSLSFFYIFLSFFFSPLVLFFSTEREEYSKQERQLERGGLTIPFLPREISRNLSEQMQLVRSFKFLPFSSFLVTFVRRWWKKASLCVFLFIFPLVFRILSLYPIRDKGKKWKLKEIATLSSIELLGFVYCKITPLCFICFIALLGVCLLLISIFLRIELESLNYCSLKKRNML